MRFQPILATALLALSFPAMAQQETIVKQPTGETVIVRTDESGTTIVNQPNAVADTPIGPEEQMHRDKVRELTDKGGKVEAEQ